MKRFFLSIACSSIFSLSMSAALAAGSAFIDESGIPFFELRALNNDNGRKALQKKLATIDWKSLDPEARVFYQGFGAAAMGNFEEAATHFEKLKRLDRLSPFAHLIIAKNYIDAEEYEKAIPFSKSILNGPLAAEGYRQLALVSHAQNKLSQARDYYLKAAEKEPAYRRDCYARAGELEHLAGRHAEALLLFDKALKIPGGRGQLLLQMSRARSYLALKKAAEAAAVYTSVIESSGRVKMNGGKDKEEYLRTLAYKERAQCYDMIGKKVEASRDRQRYKQLTNAVENDFVGSSQRP